MVATQRFLNRLAEVGEDLFSHEPFKTAIENRHEAELGERQRLVDEISKIRKASVTKTKVALAARDAARTAFEEARAVYLAANQAFNKAAGVVSSVSFRTSSQIGQRERQLRETCDPAIQDAIDALEDVERRNYRENFQADERPTGRYTMGGRALTQQVSNLHKIDARAAAIRDARQELRDLQLRAVDYVDAEINKILSRIPDESTLTIGGK